MKNRLVFLLKYGIFWLVFAFVSRLLFVIYFSKNTVGFSFYEIWMIFRKGFIMDLSVMGYILLITCVILAVFQFFSQKSLKSFLRIFTLILLTISTLIVLGDLFAFRAWGYHLDSSVVEYLKTPKNVTASASAGIWIFSAIAMVVIVSGFYWIFQKLILSKFDPDKKHWWNIVVLLLIGGAMILPIRGGVNVSPMNVSFVFFSKNHPFANQAAINPIWNFLSEVEHANKRKATFHFMDQAEADAILDSLYRSSPNYPHLLKMKRPNIVVILLESFTANGVGCLGGVPGVTPNLDSVAKQGLLFSRIYATGARSDRGVVGALAGVPSHPLASVLSIPRILSNLPSFSRDFENQGYNTHFYYTGDINFFGFKAFATNNFQKIVTEDDFSGEAIKNRNKWGVHDEYMFDKLLNDIRNAPDPSLFVAFTLSSHEPFDVPGEKRIKGSTTEEMFLNSMAYTDAELGRFIDNCKKTGIWDKTLFVFVADHGVRYVRNPEPTSLNAFHIPLIFAGGALSVKDSVVDVIGSQTDLSATLLSQFDMDHSAYRFSKNLLSVPIAQFAFFANPSAVGVVTPKGSTVFDINGRFFSRGDSIKDNCRLLEAYLQTIDKEQMN